MALVLVAPVLIVPVPAHAKPHKLDQTQAALAAARQKTAAHKAAAAKAKTRAAGDAALAAVLAQRQVDAAAALRLLEDQTAQAADRYAALQGESQAAAQALQRDAGALMALLPVMQRLAAEPAASLLAVPGSPVDAVRGVIVLQGIAGQIEARAVAVKQQAALVAALSTETKAQQRTLAAAAAVQQQAELALNQQVASAQAAEMADAQTALRETAAAIVADRTAKNLQNVIDRLRAAPATPPPVALLPARPAGKVAGGAPVAGQIVERFGDTTVAGPAQGISYRAAPGASVVTPCAGAVKFADRFQNYGLVVIMDCGAGYYVVLSGLQHLDVAAGEQLTQRQPVGAMLGFDPTAPARQPVLYVELRHNGTPVDPTAWLAGGGSG